MKKVVRLFQKTIDHENAETRKFNRDLLRAGKSSQNTKYLMMKG